MDARKLQLDDVPQFFIDDELVDNRWGTAYQTETVSRVFHKPIKEPAPVIAGHGGYVNVLRDEHTGRFRMWYQEYWNQSLKPRRYTYGVAYAESADGIHWELPCIGRFPFKGTRDNNIVLLGPDGGRAECQYLLEVPEVHRRGYRFVLLYMTDSPHSARLIGSQDGIHWDAASDTCIAKDFSPDTQGSIVWDPRRQRFLWFTRATNIYQQRGERRKVARLESDSLWGPWPLRGENILLPDSLDARTEHHYFYGMPTRYYAGIFWGFLWPYRADEDIYTSLAFSRDGRHFQRPPERTHLIDPGADTAWDAGTTLGTPNWVEVGDEWWMYYGGGSGAHKDHGSVPGIGLARLRREGFASLRSPAGGGFVVTRPFRCPGGSLCINANATGGQLRVRITDYQRRPLPGFDEPSTAFSGDEIRRRIVWPGGDIASLEGREIRLEFAMQGVVDLYTFCFGCC